MAEKNSFNFNIESGNNNRNPWMGMIVGAIVIVALFFIARFIFSLLYSWGFLILIPLLIIDYKVVINYARWIGKLFERNTIVGVVASVLTVVGYPFVLLTLLGRALFNKRVKEAQKIYEAQTKGEETDFEELDSQPLQLRELEEEEEKKNNSSSYDNMF